ncbi:MAG: Ig-like domain-containing protein [Rectinemataceae bacterium]
MFKPISVIQWIEKEAKAISGGIDTEAKKLEDLAETEIAKIHAAGIARGEKLLADFKSDAASIGLELVDSALAHLSGLQSDLETFKAAVSKPSQPAAAATGSSQPQTPVLVASIAPSPTSLTFSMASPSPKTIAAAISPANAANPALNFVSANTEVATVDAKGNVTPISVGSTQITIASVDGGASDTVPVSVGA